MRQVLLCKNNAQERDDLFMITENTKRRMARLGPEVLTNSELLELVLRRGKRNCSPKTVAESMTAEEGVYRQLARCHRVGEIMEKYEVTDEQASAVLAAVELGKRIVQAGTLENEHITSPGDAARFLMGRMRNETHEKFVVVLLNTKNRVIHVQQVAEGSLTSAVVHPREVYAPAIVNHAACIMVAHNHPSGDPYPSTEDRTLTTALAEAGNVVGIPLLDHIVIGDGQYYSFKEHGEM